MKGDFREVKREIPMLSTYLLKFSPEISAASADTVQDIGAWGLKKGRSGPVYPSRELDDYGLRWELMSSSVIACGVVAIFPVARRWILRSPL